MYQSQVVRDVSYVDLQKLLLKEMTNMVTNETLTSEQEVSGPPSLPLKHTYLLVNSVLACGGGACD